MSVPCLPTELQSKIICMLNLSDYASAYYLPYIREGFSCIAIWKKLDLEDFDTIGINDDFISLLQKFGNLVSSLEWHEAPWNCAILHSIALTYMQQLTKIDLANNVQITNLQFLLTNADLEELILRGCSNITGTEIEQIVPNLKKLKSLDITECSINGNCLHRFISNLHYIEELNIRNCLSLTIDAAVYIGKKVKTLYFCPIIYTYEIGAWMDLMEDSKYQICPASLEMLIDIDPEL